MSDEQKLSEFDFVVLIDTSGSMGATEPNGRTRYENVQETAQAFVRDVEKFDSDGIDVVLFGASVEVFPNVTSAKVDEVFASRSPRGSTPLAQALAEAVKLGKKSNKPTFTLVFTDGIPDDQNAAAKVIIDQSNSQETDEEFTFLFVQVGNDAQASAYLKKLDDDLTSAKFDIVDAKTVDEANAFKTTAELVIHAIND